MRIRQGKRIWPVLDWMARCPPRPYIGVAMLGPMRAGRPIPGERELNDQMVGLKDDIRNAGILVRKDMQIE